jgi:hypothetical protein
MAVALVLGAEKYVWKLKKILSVYCNEVVVLT